MKKRLISLTLVLAMVLSMTACGGGTAATPAPSGETAKDNTIKIGVLEPMSGGMAFNGAAQVAGIKAALKDYTEKFGNPGGFEVELIVADTEGSADVGVTQAERLITEEKVSALMGTYNSGVSVPVIPVAVKYKTPFMVVNSVSDANLQEENDYAFRANVGDSQNASLGFEYRAWLNEQIPGGIKSFYIYTNDDWGIGVIEANTKYWKDNGAKWEIIQTEPIETGVSDFSTIINKIKSSGANFVEIAMYLDDCILFMRQLKEQGLNILVNGSGGTVSADFIPALGDAADYVLTSACYLSDPSRMTEDMVAIEKEYLATVDGAKAIDEPFANGWLGMYCLLHAIDKAGSTDREAIAKALDATDLVNDGKERTFLFAPTMPRIKFEDKTGAAGYTVYNQNWYATCDFSQIQNGQYITVFPVDNSPVIVDPPAWSER